ncbi:MAB_1171c family putative transporter [Streptomyces sp. NPDC006879]|uniref:MAB_1171c family putative transporter n=1 Tax=Streptomyces sp. NPDC006879 TaxID=3364767 RepID=UPI0036C5EABC
MNLYIPAGALALVLLAKLPSLARRWRTPLVRSVNTVIFLQAAAFFFSAPPTVTTVNELTGVSNFAALLDYCILIAYAGACLVLMENWREDVRTQTGTRRRVRRWVWAHGAVIVLVIGCFILGEAPVERLRDFDTYYANTPFIREMVTLYLLANIAAATAAVGACWSWARDLRRERPEGGTGAGGTLRTGLAVLTVGFLFNLVYGTAKMVTVVAAWSGRDWEALNRVLTSFISLGTLLIALGFVIPIAGPWLAERVIWPLRTLHALGPLRRAVRPPANGGSGMRLTTPWYASPGRRLTDRMTDIHDRLLELVPHCASEVRERAQAKARRSGTSEPESVAIGLATMFQAAADAREGGVPPDRERGLVAVRALRAAEAEYGDLLVLVSRSLRVVDAPSPGDPIGPSCRTSGVGSAAGSAGPY